MDAWEQRKIGECFSERIESFPEGELLSVTINSGVRKFCELGRNDNSNDDKSKYKKVCIGDIAYNSMRMWQGASGYSPYIGIVSPAYTVLSPKPSIDSKCLAYQLKLPSIIHTFQVNSQGITSDNWNLKYPSLSKIDIIISPDKKEQEQISHFFSNIDTTIAAYQSRFEKLQSLKSAMLEKMFPKDGANVPEIRFEGFTGNWDKIKLSQIADKVTTKNTQNLITETFTNSAEYGIISQREFFDHDISKADKINGYYIVESNDFVYNPRISVTAPCGPINCNRLGRKGVMSPLYTIFRTHDIDTLFLEWYFKSPYWYSYMRFNGDSGARSDRFSIKTDLFFEMPIPVPNAEEQYKIGQALQTISNNIKLHQQELEKLQSIKKALLEKMFV